MNPEKNNRTCVYFGLESVAFIDWCWKFVNLLRLFVGLLWLFFSVPSSGHLTWMKYRCFFTSICCLFSYKILMMDNDSNSNFRKNIHLFSRKPLYFCTYFLFWFHPSWNDFSRSYLCNVSYQFFHLSSKLKTILRCCNCRACHSSSWRVASKEIYYVRNEHR